MDERIQKHVDLLMCKYPRLDVCKNDIISSYEILEEAYMNAHKLLIASNGGPAADA